MKGISIFLNEPNYEKWQIYIRKMSKAGFNGIFTSLHIPEDDPTVYQGRLQKLGELAKTYQMALIADVSPKSLDYLGHTWETAEELLQWGITGLRVDYGINEEIIANLSNIMKVALNASTITEKNIVRIIELGGKLGNMEAWHNYYPRPETALGTKEFNLKNQWLKTAGIQVMAFVPGEVELRAPLHERLPTLEKHRDTSTFSSFVELDNNEWVDHIYIGDPGISEETLEQFDYYHTDNTFLLRVEVSSNDQEMIQLLKKRYTNRMDAARDVIRAEESRGLTIQNEQTIEPQEEAIRRTRGSITIDNRNYGRYQGEIQITKRDLPKDWRVNILGHIIKDDIDLVDFIRGGSVFIFQDKN